MHAVQTLTDQLTLVVLDVRIWSGRRKLRPEDLKLGTEVPPADLVSLGSKRICNPEALCVFHRNKKAAERACLLKGTRFLGGFAIARDQAEAVADTLDAVKAEFDAQTARFLAGYDRALEDWILSLPQWEAPIRRAIEPASVVRTRLKFGFQLLRVGPAEHCGTLGDEVNSLGNGIFAEVEQMAREMEDSFLGKDVLHRRALGTFRRIREKLACLSFVDLRIQPVVDTIDAWFGRVPTGGPITGALFNEGHGLALLLGDAQRMARHGAGQWALQQGQAPTPREGQEVDVAVSAIAPEAAPAAPAASLPSPSGMSFEDELDALFGPTVTDSTALDAPVSPTRAPVMDTDARDTQPSQWTAPAPERPRPETEEGPALAVETFFF